MITRPSAHFPSVTLESGSQAGIQEAENALNKIASRPSGATLLNKLDTLANKGRVTILVGASGTDMKNIARPVPQAHISTRAKLLRFLGSNRSDAHVEWNPERALTLDDDGHPTGRERNPDKAYLSLAHELVHAYRIVNGSYTGHDGPGTDPSTPKGKEELRAVGLGEFAKRPFSENTIRAEQGEPLRTSYPLQAERARPASFDGTARMQEGPLEEELEAEGSVHALVSN